MKRLPLYCLVTTLLWAGSLFSQEKSTPPQAPPPQPEYTFKTDTTLVILDIVAVDPKGNVVADLKPDEITILENGKEQKKRDFTFVRPNPEEAAKLVELHLPPDVYTNVQQYKGNSSFNIIVFDVLNTSFTNFGYAHDQLLKYLDENLTNQPTAIFALGYKLWMLHDFTTDHEALKQTIRRFQGQGSKLVVASDDGKYQRKSTFSVGFGDAWSTVEAMKSLARMMSAYPGRKNLIWISQSFINPIPDINAPRGPSFLSNYARELEQMSDAMMEAQIAVYAIDAAGLSGNAFRPMNFGFLDHASLRDVAERTGGKAFINRNDIAAGISHSIDDGSSYYTTSYSPLNQTWDGRLRKIQLKCSRPGVTLRYRQGYYGVKQQGPPKNKEDIKAVSYDFADALDPDLPASTALPFQAQVVPPSGPGKKVVVNFAIDPHMVLFERKDDGLRYAQVSCIAWAFPVKGKPIGSRGGTVNAKIDEATYQQVMRSAFPCNQSLELPPGNYMLRIGAIDQSTRRIGATTAWVTVPETAAPVVDQTKAEQNKTPEQPK
jgi:VWFA-related protein